MRLYHCLSYNAISDCRISFFWTSKSECISSWLSHSWLPAAWHIVRYSPKFQVLWKKSESLRESCSNIHICYFMLIKPLSCAGALLLLSVCGTRGWQCLRYWRRRKDHRNQDLGTQRRLHCRVSVLPLPCPFVSRVSEELRVKSTKQKQSLFFFHLRFCKFHTLLLCCLHLAAFSSVTGTFGQRWLAIPTAHQWLKWSCLTMSV